MKHDTKPDLPAIVLDRHNRTLQGGNGERVQLPVLTLRLLEALAASAPAFVESEELQQLVWPDTHITSDALKQRIRLLRRALTDAGYDARLVDSARGEGYALLARLAAPTVERPTQTERRTMRPVWWGLAAIAVVVIAFVATLRTPQGEAPSSFGPSPVRIAILAVDNDPVARFLIDALSATAHVLLVPPGSEGGDPPCSPTRSHLCLSVEPVAAQSAWSVTLTQSVTGGIFLRTSTRPENHADMTLLGTQIAQFAVPGVLRWIGGRTGAGDQTFTWYREGVRHLQTCDRNVRADIIEGLRAAAERSPQFVAGRALLALHETLSAAEQRDLATIQQVLASLTELTAPPNELALAHLATAEGARVLGDETLAREARARAERLQPILAHWTACKA